MEHGGPLPACVFAANCDTLFHLAAKDLPGTGPRCSTTPPERHAGRPREEAINGLWSGFVRIPRHVVHREVNAGSVPSREVISRPGGGPLTVNVDGPSG